MADKTYKECLEVSSSFLDKESLDYLAKKHRDSFKLNDFMKDFLEALCNSFNINYGAKVEDHFEQIFEENNDYVSSVVGRIPELFPCNTLLDGFKDYFQLLTEAKKDIVQILKLFKIVLEVLKSCSKLWLLQTKEGKNLEMDDLDKTKEDIVAFLLFLLKQIDLMTLNAKEMEHYQKLKLVPGIILICQSLLRKLHQNTEEIPDIISRNFEISILKKIACNAIMVAMQHTGSRASKISRNTAINFLEFVSDLCGCSDIVALLSGSDGKTSNTGMENKIFPNGLLGNILQSIKHFIVKDKLVEMPIVVHVLVCCVRQVWHPYLGQHISMLLPPLLMLLDDFRVSNRITGIKTLEHVIENTNATELCWYGRAEVIYEALHHRIHSNDADIMIALQPCLLKILKVIEPLPTKPISGRKMNKCDQNFQIILSAMEFESKIAMRRAYCSHLVQFINHMGITVVRHFKRLLQVVFRYLEISDGETEEWRLVMLDVLAAIVTVAWPRIPTHADDILRSLLKLIIDVSPSEDVKQSIFVKIKECLLLLLFCCGEHVERQVRTLTTGIGHDEAEKLISDVLHSYTSHAIK